MKGKAPMSIITDQDATMRCPALDEDVELEEDFKEFMNHSMTLDEFEAAWAAMMNKYGLKNDVHFQRLYAIKSSFVPAYYMHCFYPFLQSTQRSEGFNAMLKKYVNPNMFVLHFVRQYQKIQDKYLVAQDG
ncbi:hypothetical protein C2845_PM18G10390 [Panicum miliaceum]|uniref:Protein FAR1-RELATED SEQUENCE n=1 Tax=Panicum miliaceum TaxID=4540 RepID=A0A3L6PM41_PANMI|nr:hypothetical protein C2845_PM18G10390 [Panicum miliaceum]